MVSITPTATPSLVGPLCQIFLLGGRLTIALSALQGHTTTRVRWTVRLCLQRTNFISYTTDTRASPRDTTFIIIITLIHFFVSCENKLFSKKYLNKVERFSIQTVWSRHRRCLATLLFNNFEYSNLAFKSNGIFRWK